jgi:hypothetical protein
MCSAKADVRFTPESDIKCDIWMPEEGQITAVQESTAATRGKITLISVNSSGSVSTSIEPPCCLTMMSWLMERRSPAPVSVVPN